MLIENVSFSYPGKPVLEGFTLQIPDRGVTALSGPSGCGKTTLLRLISGLLTPASGKISAPAPERISILFQENRLLPGFTAASQLRAVLPHGTDITPYLAAVGLEAEARTRIEALSGGMRRRVALARAMAYAVGRELLILDEPFTGVDPATAQKIMAHLRSLNIPILLSAHDAETLSLADTPLPLSGPPLTPLNAP